MRNFDISFNPLRLGTDEQYYISQNLLKLEIFTANNVDCLELDLELFTLPRLIELYIESSHIRRLNFEAHSQKEVLEVMSLSTLKYLDLEGNDLE